MATTRLNTRTYAKMRRQLKRQRKEGSRRREKDKEQWRTYFRDIKGMRPKMPHLISNDDFDRRSKGSKLFVNGKKRTLNANYTFKRNQVRTIKR